MKQTNFKYGILISALLVLLILAASCETINPYNPPGSPNTPESSQKLKKFSSTQELKDFLDKASVSQGTSRYFGGGIASDMMMDAKSLSAAPQSESGAGNSQRASEYSATNIQVQGVDEADFVKNDDKYIYTLTQNKLVIVDAYPAENAKVASETKVSGNPRNLFLNKDRVIVFSDDNGEVPVLAQYDYMPRPRYTPRTHVFVYDVSDKENPKLLKDYNLNGYYFDSRMIGEYVYFISQENVYYYNRILDVPAIMQSSKIVARPEIYYFDNAEYNYNFNTVASFNIFEDKDEVNAKTFMMGYTNSIYVSENNIYITYRKNLPYYYYEVQGEERFYKAVVPLFPSDVRSSINEIKDDGSQDANKKWDKISTILEDMYGSMGKDETAKLIAKIENAVQEYEAKQEAERMKTVIHRIKIDNGKIDYGSKGEVPGHALNQFSMDENNGYFRIATTTEFYGIAPMAETKVEQQTVTETKTQQPNVQVISTQEEKAEKVSAFPVAPPMVQRKYIMYNNVFVLDGSLNVVGKLEALAPDERIYSARFMGDRLYMVTFKRVDPLFVIDLSDPKNPEVLGQLKIPGFSDYLHPYDDKYVIGIGKETEGNEWGGTSIKGVKLALFDVSDVRNPKQAAKYEIGEAGTDSEALRDHKAFLFDKKKNLLVIPVTEVKGKLIYNDRLGYYTQRYWQGAYVFSLTPEDGFKVKGTISHNEGDEQQYYYWYGSPNAVRRSLFMDDVLYTVSGIKIKANDLADISKELKTISLPYEKEVYPVVYAQASGGRGVAME